MCSAILLLDKNILFGRNMDIDFDLNEEIINLPKGFEIKYKFEGKKRSNYLIKGIGKMINGFPFFADAINEEGIGYAALAFKDNCVYETISIEKQNYAPYELPLATLSNCKSIEEIRSFLENISIVNEPFSNEISTTPLHFIFASKEGSIVLEITKNGKKIYDNPYGVLTNNPPFSYHLENVKNYLHLHNFEPKNELVKERNIKPYSYNLGALGLPGDYSSCSRFIKALYVKNNLILDGSTNDVNEFFKCLDSVSMIRGCVKTENGYEITRYSVCYDLLKNEMYYKTYFDNKIRRIY